MKATRALNDNPKSNEPLEHPVTDEATTTAEMVESDSQAVDRMVKGSAAIAVITLVTKAAGFLWKPIISYLFGTTEAGNAFNFVYEVSNRLYKAWELLIFPSFLPVLSRVRKEDGDDAAWRFTSNLFSLQAVLLVLAGIGIFVFAPTLFDLMADEKFPRELSIELLRISVIGIVILSFSSTSYQTLNRFKRFSWSHLGEFTNRVGQILGLVVFYYLFKYLTGSGVYGLALAFVTGAVLKFGTHLVGLGKLLKEMTLSFDWFGPRMKQLYIMMGPLLLGVLFALVRDLIEYRLRTGVIDGDAMSLVGYARLLGDTFVTMIPLGMGIVLMPFISEYATEDRNDRLFDLLWGALRFCVVIFLPLMLYMIVFRYHLIQFLFQRGEFAEEPMNLPRTAVTMAWYAPALLGLAFETILMQFYFAKKNTWLPTAVGVVTSLLLLGVMYLAITRWESHPAAGFTLAHSVARNLKALLLVILLPMIFAGIGLWRKELGLTGRSMLKVMVALAVATLVWLGTASLLLGCSLTEVLAGTEAGRLPARAGLVKKLAYLLIIFTPGFLVLLGGYALLRVREFMLAYGWIRQKLRRVTG